MPKIVLAPALARWLPDLVSGKGEPVLDARGDSLRDALDDVFARYPTLRGYVVDERNAVRHHVAIFVDGIAIADKTRLDVPVSANAEIYVMQALSGG